MEEIRLVIEGMSCQHCVQAVSKAIRALPGVEAVEVSLEGKIARVRYDPVRTDRAAMVQAVSEAGYAVAPAGAQ